MYLEFIADWAIIEEEYVQSNSEIQESDSIQFIF